MPDETSRKTFRAISTEGREESLLRFGLFTRRHFFVAPRYQDGRPTIQRSSVLRRWIVVCSFRSRRQYRLGTSQILTTGRGRESILWTGRKSQGPRPQGVGLHCSSPCYISSLSIHLLTYSGGSTTRIRGVVSQILQSLTFEIW